MRRGHILARAELAPSTCLTLTPFLSLLPVLMPRHHPRLNIPSPSPLSTRTTTTKGTATFLPWSPTGRFYPCTIPANRPRADMTNPSQHFFPQTLSVVNMTLQVVLEPALQMKPLCPPIHEWENGDWCGADTLQGCKLASAACQEQDFSLLWAVIPKLWVLGFLVLYLLSSHFSFTLLSLPPRELSFSSTDLISSLPYLIGLKNLLALPSAHRDIPKLQTWHQRPRTPSPKYFSVSPPANLCTYAMAKPPLGFLNPAVPFRPLCLCVCCSSCLGMPFPTALVSYCCCNTSPQTQWLKITQI